MVQGLTETEKAYFNTIRDKAPTNGALSLVRMVLRTKDDPSGKREVAVIGCDVFNRFTGKKEGWMPLAILVDESVTSHLRSHEGAAPTTASPFDLDPSR